MLTVCTVVLNSEKTIGVTLKSLISHDSVKKVIIKDGGSTDGTLETIATILAETGSPKVKVISKKDTGIYDAMNQAMEYVDIGNWFIFLNADDEIITNQKLDFLYTAKKIIVTGLIMHDRFRIKTVFLPKLNKKNVYKSNLHHQGFIVCKTKDLPRFDLTIGQMADFKWMSDCIHHFGVEDTKVTKKAYFKATFGGISDENLMERIISRYKLNVSTKQNIFLSFDFYKDLLKILFPNKLKYWVRLLKSKNNLE